MALLLGAIVCLFLLFGIHLIGAGVRNPTVVFVLFVGIFGLHKYNQHQLETESEFITVRVFHSPQCAYGAVKVQIQNNRLEQIRELKVLIVGFQPNYSNSITAHRLVSDRIINADSIWAECVEIPKLTSIQDVSHAGLVWTSEIQSIELAD